MCDYYTILGVLPDATAEELYGAYSMKCIDSKQQDELYIAFRTLTSSSSRDGYVSPRLSRRLSAILFPDPRFPLFLPLATKHPRNCALLCVIPSRTTAVPKHSASGEC